MLLDVSPSNSARYATAGQTMSSQRQLRGLLNLFPTAPSIRIQQPPNQLLDLLSWPELPCPPRPPRPPASRRPTWKISTLLPLRPVPRLPLPRRPIPPHSPFRHTSSKVILCSAPIAPTRLVGGSPSSATQSARTGRKTVDGCVSAATRRGSTRRTWAG